VLQTDEQTDKRRNERTPTIIYIDDEDLIEKDLYITLLNI